MTDALFGRGRVADEAMGAAGEPDPISPPSLAASASRRAAPDAPPGAAAAAQDIGDRRIFLSTVSPTRRDWWLAGTLATLSLVVFAALAPFAKVQLPAVPAFVPAYESALLLIDLITAVLLLGQFAQLRSSALLVLAAGYFYDGLLVIPHALTFPGLISPTGWLGAHIHTTAWLYMFWHGGFPLFAIGYSGLNRRAGRDLPGRLGPWLATGAAGAVIALAIALTLLATEGHDLLPPMMAGNSNAIGEQVAALTVWALTAAALLVLLLNRSYSLLDLWLVVVMVAWLADIGLSAVFNAARFDLGFYFGRLYGLSAASFVLAVILVETSGLQSRLAAAAAQLANHTRELDRRVRERTAELTRTNEKLSAVLAASPFAIFMLAPNGAVTLWTASAVRLFGYAEDEAIGRVPPYLSGEQMAEFQTSLNDAAGSGAATGFVETRLRRRDGATIDVSARWARVNDEAGQFLGILYAVADITERKKLEDQLRQAQKMEAIGNLTGGMAHDFNNLLGVVIGNLDLLRDQGMDRESDELARDALDAALRGADLTRRLLAFARQQPLQATQVSVNELVSGITKLLSRTLGEHIEISLDLSADAWPTVVDSAQLEAALTNLATNARDAMPHGGKLVIATGNRTLDADYAGLHAEVTPGDYVMIRVSDTGTGMTPAVRERVFEPFFTTKERGRGTGLGLSMVFGFIKQSGGHVNVYSELGTGTIFRLYLPRMAEETRGAEEPAAATWVGGNGETVLAVEDNAALRRVVVRQLGELGYSVLEAENAAAALAVLERESVDLLLTDIVMPGGTDGLELARQIGERWPQVKVVFTSGFPETALNGGDGAPMAGARLLSKPYRREELAAAIRAALDA